MKRQVLILKVSLAAIFIVFVLDACDHPTQTSQLIGTYEACGFFRPSTQLVLENDGEFHFMESSFDCFDGEYVYLLDGHWLLRDGYVVFAPELQSQQTYRWDSLISMGRTLTYDTVYPVDKKPDHFGWNDSVAVVTLNKRLFLLGTDSLASADGAMEVINLK